MAYEIRTTFDVDISQILRAVDKLDNQSSNVFNRISDKVIGVAREFLNTTFDEALMTVPHSQFSQWGRDSMMANVAELPITADVTADHCIIEVNFEQLGTRDDLTLAFHRHAKLATGDKLEGEYTGQALKNPLAVRYTFVRALMEGTSWGDYREDDEGNLTGKLGEIPTGAGRWEDTLDDRVEIWEAHARSPFWLYLEFGQQAFDPQIEPFGVTDRFEQLLFPEANAIFNEEWEEAIARVQELEAEGATQDVEGGLTGRFRYPAGDPEGRGGRLGPKP